VKTFRFNLGFVELSLRFAWPFRRAAWRIRKYEILDRAQAPEIKRSLVRRMHTNLREAVRGEASPNWFGFQPAISLSGHSRFDEAPFAVGSSTRNQREHFGLSSRRRPD